MHSVALSADGHVYTWGDHENGKCGHAAFRAVLNQLKDASSLSYNQKELLEYELTGPKRIDSLERVKRIACGKDHSIAFVENDGIYAWGKNNYG